MKLKNRLMNLEENYIQEHCENMKVKIWEQYLNSLFENGDFIGDIYDIHQLANLNFWIYESQGITNSKALEIHRSQFLKDNLEFIYQIFNKFQPRYSSVDAMLRC